MVIKINVRGVVVMKILAVIVHVTFVDIIGRWSRDWHAFTWSSVSMKARRKHLLCRATGTGGQRGLGQLYPKKLAIIEAKPFHSKCLGLLVPSDFQTFLPPCYVLLDTDSSLVSR